MITILQLISTKEIRSDEIMKHPKPKINLIYNSFSNRSLGLVLVVIGLKLCSSSEWWSLMTPFLCNLKRWEIMSGVYVFFWVRLSIFLHTKTPSVPQTLPDWKVPILDLGSNTLNRIIIQDDHHSRELVPSYRPHQNYEANLRHLYHPP